MAGRYGRYNRQSGSSDHFHNHQVTRTEFKNLKIFQNASIPNTRAEDSSFRVEAYPSYVTNSVDKLPIGRINISPQKIAEIESVLDNMDPISNVPYEEMKNSLFKQNFLEKRMGEMDKKMDFFMEKMERKVEVDQELFVENNQKLEDPDYMRLYDKRKRLPSFEKRNQIIKMIEQNQVVLISGDTGCGKTTQIPQFILDHYINGYMGSVCKIICTQPRRISAISVAGRVAVERGEPLGISCGYQIRLEKVLPRKYGSIMYVTNGIVIRHMESDPSLNNISHLILDEVHERDIHSDFLLALVKQLISKRKDLKVILMSATLNEQRFCEFFNFCPHVVIEGIAHPVEEYYLEDVVDRLNYRFNNTSMTSPEVNQFNSMMFVNKVLPYVSNLMREGLFSDTVCRELKKPCSEELNIDLIFKLTLDICENEEEGAILIFVTGFDDINKLYQLFCDNLSEEEYILIALHSQIPMEEQKQVFEQAPPGMRKIVISTNIAETSITIDDVVYVIDSGWAKIKTYDARLKTENLEARFISKANAIQRRGRAGRLRAGKCFRLYTKARFDAFYEFQKPEILRSRLETIILQMKLLQLGMVRDFFAKLLDQPESYIVNSALSLLSQLGALDEEESLTFLGYYLAKLPISPQLGKMLLLGVLFSCLDPILNVAVGLDYKSPFILNMRRNNNKNRVDEKLLEFSEGVKSDHLLLHKALSLYQTISKESRPDFCKQFNLNMEVMVMLKNLKKEFMENLMDLQLVASLNSNTREYNLNSANIAFIKSIICAGLYPNIIIALPQMPRMIFQTVDGKKVQLHMKSVLSSDRFFSCPLLSYYIRMKTNSDRVHDATVCSPYPIIFFGDKFRIEKTQLSNYIIVNNMKFSCDKNVSTIIELLRDRLEQYLLHKMSHPEPFDSARNKSDMPFLRVIVDLLSSPEN